MLESLALNYSSWKKNVLVRSRNWDFISKASVRERDQKLIIKSQQVFQYIQVKIMYKGLGDTGWTRYSVRRMTQDIH